MSEMIEALLKLSVVGRGEIMCQSVDLTGLAETIANNFRQQEPERAVEV